MSQIDLRLSGKLSEAKDHKDLITFKRVNNLLSFASLGSVNLYFVLIEIRKLKWFLAVFFHLRIAANQYAF